MVCCRCNRAGVCRGCACVKAKRPYVNCLPSKQGNCANISTAIPNATSNAFVPSTSTLSLTSRIHCSTSCSTYTSAINTSPVSTDSVGTYFAPAITQAVHQQLQFLLQLVHPAAQRIPSCNNNLPLELHNLQ